MKKIIEKKAPSTILKKKCSPETKSFVEVIVGTKHGAHTEVVRVSVGDEEITEKLRKLSCCFVGW